MGLSRQKVRGHYEATAGYYDLALCLYALIGIGKAFRKRAVDLLGLKPGDCVVELGCGTGVNFPPVHSRIGPTGKLIGIDISAGTLAGAQIRVESAGWKNVELVEQDIVAYSYPGKVDAILSTGVFGYLDDADKVIQKASWALNAGRSMVVMDGKRPDRLPHWLFRFIVWVSKPFGVTCDYFEKKTWETMEKHFSESRFEDMYGGMLYFSIGRKAGPSGD